MRFHVISYYYVYYKSMLPWLLWTFFYFRFSWIVAFSTSTWPRQWTTTSSLLTIFKPSSGGKYNFQYPNYYIFFFGMENERTSCFIFMPFTVWWKLLRNKKLSIVGEPCQNIMLVHCNSFQVTTYLWFSLLQGTIFKPSSGGKYNFQFPN